LTACMALGSTSCLGMDFDENNNSCWFFLTTATECGALTPATNIIHIRITTCTATG